MKTHLTDGLGFTQCGLTDDSVRTTSNVKNVRCKKCRKSKVYKRLKRDVKPFM
jgi:hypothetical protein